MRRYNRYSFSICDLFPLINLCLVVTLLTRDLGIHTWAKLEEERILSGGNNPPRNPQHLWDQVVEIWDDLAQDHDYSLILSTICPEEARRSYMPVACVQGVRSTSSYIVVCFKLFVFICFVGNKIYFPM